MFKLILPILFPSWRFFRCIDPSPRIEYGYCESFNDEPERWFPLSTIPENFNYNSAIFRLFFNASWNQQLFMNTCAEHLYEGANDRWESFIAGRIIKDKKIMKIAHLLNRKYIRFRIKAIMRDNKEITSSIAFISKPIATNKS